MVVTSNDQKSNVPLMSHSEECFRALLSMQNYQSQSSRLLCIQNAIDPKMFMITKNI